MRALASLLPILVAPAVLAQVVIDIEVRIDGLDWLIIKQNTLQWHHFARHAPGRIPTAIEPTTISTSLDGSVEMDRVDWMPDWPEPAPDPVEYEAFSSAFVGLSPPVPTDGTRFWLEEIECREDTRIVEQPSPANDHALVVEFDDMTTSGSAVYRVRLSTAAPELRPRPTCFRPEQFVPIETPVGISFDSAGNLYVGNSPPGGGQTGEGFIRFVSKDGGTVRLLGAEPIPDADWCILDEEGYVFDPGDIIVGSYCEMYRISGADGTVSRIFEEYGSSVGNVSQMAFDSTGRLFYGTIGYSVLFVNEYGYLNPYATFSGIAQGMCIDHQDQLYVGQRSQGTIYRLDLRTLAPRELIGAVDGTIRSLAITDTGMLAGLLVVDTGEGIVYGVDPNTGETRVLLESPWSGGLAFSPEGVLHISKQTDNAIYRVAFVPEVADISRPPEVAVSWTWCGPCAEYTVETRNSLWDEWGAAHPAASWPITATHWTDPTAAQAWMRLGRRFYRVRAEVAE